MKPTKLQVTTCSGATDLLFRSQEQKKYKEPGNQACRAQTAVTLFHRKSWFGACPLALSAQHSQCPIYVLVQHAQIRYSNCCQKFKLDSAIRNREKTKLWGLRKISGTFPVPPAQCHSTSVTSWSWSAVIPQGRTD